MAGEEAADRPGADDADAVDHARLRGLPDTTASSRKPELPSPRQPLRQEHEHDGHEDRDADEATSAPEWLSDQVVDETDLAALGPEEERVERADASAPTTAPQRLPTPPTTSIARVRNVRSR